MLVKSLHYYSLSISLRNPDAPCLQISAPGEPVSCRTGPGTARRRGRASAGTDAAQTARWPRLQGGNDGQSLSTVSVSQGTVIERTEVRDVSRGHDDGVEDVRHGRVVLVGTVTTKDGGGRVRGCLSGSTSEKPAAGHYVSKVHACE